MNIYYCTQIKQKLAQNKTSYFIPNLKKVKLLIFVSPLKHCQPSPAPNPNSNKIKSLSFSWFQKKTSFFFFLLTLWCLSHHWPTTQPSSPQLEALTSRYLILISILSLYFSKLNLVYVWITLKTANMCVCVFLSGSRALFPGPTSTDFNKFFFKTRSHNTIHTVKNYFATVFSILSFQQ